MEPVELEALLRSFVAGFRVSAPVMRQVAQDFSASAEAQQQIVMDAMETIEKAKQYAAQFADMAADMERLVDTGAAILGETAADTPQTRRARKWR